jgi:hypothetical protein
MARVALGLGHLHQLGGVGQLLLDRPGRGDRLVEAAALAHHHLRRLGIVPQFRVLDLRVELASRFSARSQSRNRRRRSRADLIWSTWACASARMEISGTFNRVGGVSHMARA